MVAESHELADSVLSLLFSQEPTNKYMVSIEVRRIMSDRTKYRELCMAEPTIPIFSQDWWLDAVCGEANWDVITLEKNNDIYATLPYYFQNKRGSLYITMPLLTQTLGPWMRPTKAQKYRTKLGSEMDTLSKLVEAIPPFKSFEQYFHHSITTWLPFYWNGYRQTTRYTYIFPDLTNLDRIYEDVDHGVRKYISKAKDEIDVVETEDLRRFYEINTAVFTKQDRKVPYSYEFLSQLDGTLRRRGKRSILFAVDKSGELRAGLYLVWSGDCTYSLMSGIDPKFQNDGALRLLFWEGIKNASKVTRTFDFEGSMLKPVERNFRKFGPIQTPYLHVYKKNTFQDKLTKSLSDLRHGRRGSSKPKADTDAES